MGGGSLSFQLFGFPVDIHMSFVAIVAIIGYTSVAGDIALTIAFLVIALAAVLIHELGHALAARSQGTREVPTITLAGMAGLTRYRPATQPTRLQSIFISFAGPLTGIVLGLILVAVRVSGLFEPTEFVDDLFLIGFFTTFGWSGFNLLPIVPLDGGHMMTDMLPGSPPVRQRRAAIVSIAICALVGFALWSQGIIFGAILLAFFAFQNITILNATSSAATNRGTLSQPPPPIVQDEAEADLTND